MFLSIIGFLDFFSLGGGEEARILILQTKPLRFPIPYCPKIEGRRTSECHLSVSVCLSVCLSLYSVDIVRAMKIYDIYVDSMWEMSIRHWKKMPNTTTLLPQSCPHSTEIPHTGTHSYISQSVEPKTAYTNGRTKATPIVSVIGFLGFF